MPMRLMNPSGPPENPDGEGAVATDPLIQNQTQHNNSDEDGHWEYKLNLFSASASLLSLIILLIILNLFSASASLLSLIILLIIDRAMLFQFQTWAPFTTSVRSNTSVGLVRNFASRYEDVCEIKNLNIAKFDVNVTTNDKEVTKYLVMPLTYELETVPASLLLIWVLAVSVSDIPR